MFKNRTRLLQLAFATVAAIGVVPMVSNDEEWPHLSEQEQEMVTALREANPTMVAQQASSSASSQASSSAQVEVVQTKRVKARSKKMVATAPEPEEHFTVAPTHYRLRDTKVIREIAKLEQDEE